MIGGCEGNQTLFAVLKTFDFHQVRNMLALMLDPHLKSLWTMESFVGCGNAIHLVTKYDHHVNEIIPFLMKG